MVQPITIIALPGEFINNICMQLSTQHTQSLISKPFTFRESAWELPVGFSSFFFEIYAGNSYIFLAIKILIAGLIIWILVA